MNSDVIGTVTDAINSLLLGYGDMFQGMGANLFRDFALILIVWFGATTALSASDGGGMPFGQFIRFLFRLAFGYTFITYYNTPIPGLGLSFVHIFADQAQFLVKALNAAGLPELWSSLNGAEVGLAFPSWYEVGAIIKTVLLLGAILFAETCVLAVISFGYVAVGVTVLLGPIFVPFFIVPEMEWMFWGWFRCFIQYLFYPVVGNAYVFVWAKVLLHFFQDLQGPFTVETIQTHFGPAVVVLVGFGFGALKIPALVHGLFTGHAGVAAFPTFGR